MRLAPAIFVVAVLASHAPFYNLPFFWDEIGQFIPASLDLYHSGALVPYSVTPNVHPPGVMAYLAAVWSIAGYSVTATRAAMLVLAAVSVWIAFQLAQKLGAPPMLAVAMLCCSPLFYAQAMLAQLDMPAMLFTLLATLLFLQDRFLPAAIACIFAVLVKETAIVTPMLFGFWLLVEKRIKEAIPFVLPAVALGAWLLILKTQTGQLFGSASFTQYNLTYMLQPTRIVLALGKRLYHLFWENFHWMGAIGLFLGSRAGIFASRSWRIVWTLVALHVLLFSLLGGAMLERYLLPVTPMVYMAMAAGWFTSPRRLLGPAALIAALAACNFWNPPYPFPLENNLAFTDFVRLQQSAASFLEEKYPTKSWTTEWPLSAALATPDFGYVMGAHQVEEVVNIDKLKAPPEVFVLYSRQWDPSNNLLHNTYLGRLWKQAFSFKTPIPSAGIDRNFGMKIVASWRRRGQWIEVHAK